MEIIWIILSFLAVANATMEEALQAETLASDAMTLHELARRGVVTSASGNRATPSQLQQQQQQILEINEIETNVQAQHDMNSPSFLRPRLLHDGQQEDDSSDVSLEFWSFANRDHAKDDSTCSGQKNCENCVTHSSWCHWCEKQGQCHSKGSFYGCFSGVTTCDANNHTVDPDDQHGCAAHATCGDCATASHFCHWCAHDQACHAIGSVYGCATGVDCYSNDRCQRKTPERLPRVKALLPQLSQLHALPVAIVLGVAALILCCATVCFCICSGVKGAYDDLAVISYGGDEDNGDAQEPLLSSSSSNAANDDENSATENDIVPTQESAETVEQGAAETATAEESLASAVEQGNAENQTDENQTDNPVTHTNEENTLVDGSDGVEPRPTIDSTAHRRSIRPRRPRHMQRLYNACSACYAVTVFTMCTMVFCALYFYPQMPVYNICNDNVAWKSIIDSMTKMHTEAEFEILASLKNQNHISVALDKGTGYFHHNGKFAGTFTIPPFTAEAMSITDFLLIAHLTPETWDAVQIAKEYTEGHLILHVNTTVVVRVPSLADFTYQGAMDNITVYVNEVLDRSLCACPTWDDAKNHSHNNGAFGLDSSSSSLQQQESDKLALQLPFLPES